MAALLFTRGVLCRGADHPQRRAPRQASAARRAPWLETVRHHVPWPHSAALIFCMAPIRPYTQVKPRRGRLAAAGRAGAAGGNLATGMDSRARLVRSLARKSSS